MFNVSYCRSLDPDAAMIEDLSARTKILLGFILILVLCVPAWAGPVATISRIAGEAVIIQPSPKILTEGSSVAMGDTIATRQGARLELRFVDGMILTLGENARMLIDDLIYDPATAEGKAALTVSMGAFRVITGGIAKQPDHPFSLTTPYASIGVRGTDFWGGPLDDPFAMVSLDGTIVITTPAGTTILTKGQGIEIKALGGATSTPHPWSPEKTQRAISTVTFP